MRFTKIPLIATLMAVALSLLIVLPMLAQVSGDRTDGRLSVGSWVDVRVADNLDDLDNGAANPQDDTPANIGAGGNAWATGDEDAFQARDTYFNGDLYISNDAKAYNTILITAIVGDEGDRALMGPNGRVDDTATDDTDESEGECLSVSPDNGTAIATIRNDRSGARVTAYLAPTNEREGGTVRIYQGIAVIWDQEDSIESHNGPCDVAHTYPLKIADDAAEDDQTEDGWTHASAAVVPARDGDSVTVTVKGVSGSIRLIVDGDAPEIEDVSPTASDPQKSTTVDVEFTVSDDGSGIRYDGESGSSTDVDLQPHNGDGDQRFDEPITTGAAHDGNGSTMDIQVYFTGEKDSAYNPQAVDEDGVALEDTTDPLNPMDILEDGTTGTPVTDVTTGKVGLAANQDAKFNPDTESSAYGSNAWTQRDKGEEYALDMRLTGNSFGTYYWQVTVKDRVGNSATTDGDEDERGDQPYSFKVDDADPEVALARTGIGYEAGEGEVKSRSWIALHFVNGEGKTGDDRIRPSSVQASDFTVEGHTVIDAIVPSDKPVCKADKPDTDEEEDAKNINWYPARNAGLSCKGYDARAHVYLELADELDSDEEPTIQLLGGVLQDIAGNNNATQSLEDEVQDWIAPGVTILITSSSETSNRAATDDEGSFTVRVESDEELSRFPRLFFATIAGTVDDGEASGLTIADVEGPITMTEREENVWDKKVDTEDTPGHSDDRILAVIVTAADDPGNSGNSAGWTDGQTERTQSGFGVPQATEKLNFKKLDAGNFLVEVDSSAPEAVIKVLPATDPNAETLNETESMNPYIQLDFNEPNEYGIGAGGACLDSDAATAAARAACAEKADIGDGDTANTDSHSDVTITALTINGEDRLAEVQRVRASRYVLAVTGLAIGEYTITYSAMDDVGNETEDEESDFEVLERQPYEITLNPGWNLISVPGDPFNPAVGNVIGDLRADTVLGYQGGEWITAVRDEDGRWMGTLTDIRGGYGYWVRTSVVEDIETVIPPILPTDVLPVVPIVSGWNLVGIVDAEQRNAGTAHDADEYLTSLEKTWRVAYSYDTQQNRWDKLLPSDDEAAVTNGRGYWLWNTAPGALVP